MLSAPAMAGQQCHALFANSVLQQQAVKNLDRLFNSRVATTGESSSQGTYPQYFYRAGKLVVQQSGSSRGVIVGSGEIKLSYKAMVSRKSVQYTPESRSNSVSKNDMTFEISKDGKLMAKSNSKSYILAALADARDIVSTDRSIYVLEDSPDGRSLREIAIPEALPQTTDMVSKQINIAASTATVLPVILAYGDYLILGGNSLSILKPSYGSLVELRMDDDYGRNPIVALTDLGDGKISVIRKIFIGNYLAKTKTPDDYRIDEIIIDLNSLIP